MKSFMNLLAFLLICFNTFQSNSQTFSALYANEMFAAFESEEGEITLQWQTSREVNTRYFIIEKSYDGIRYEVFGTTRAAGSSMLTKNYQVSDQADPNRKIFYRILLVMMDGNRTVSNIVVLDPAAGKMLNPGIKTTEIQSVVQK